MYSLTALLKWTSILAFTCPLVACASLPQAAAPLVFGAAAPAPRGYVEYCERQVADCGASPAQLAELMQQVEPTSRDKAVGAIAFDWSKAFASDPPQPVPRAQEATLLTSAFDAAPQPLSTPEPRATPLAMTAELWAEIKQTNEQVNRAIIRGSDLATYGVADYWATPLLSGVQRGDCEDYVLEKRRSLVAAGVPATALSIAIVSTSRGEPHAVLLVDTSTGEYVLDNLTPWILPWNKTDYIWRKRQLAGSPIQWVTMTGSEDPVVPNRGLLLASAR